MTYMHSWWQRGFHVVSEAVVRWTWFYRCAKVLVHDKL